MNNAHLIHKARVGTISSGTHHPLALVAAFATELYYLDSISYRGLLNRAQAWLDGEEGDENEDLGDELFEELMEALNDFAPDYCYFGAREGDGADFGFWPLMDQIDALPRVEGQDEARELGEDCAFINDHGNVTVYGGDGTVLLDIV